MNDVLIEFLRKAERLMDRLDAILPKPLVAPHDWSSAIAWRYRKQSTGSGVLEPVQHIAKIGFDDLIEVGGQKDKLFYNTAQFVAGQPANNVLLTGARGTGKSSLIRACLQHFAPQGLRLIEVDKDDLVDLPDIVSVIGNAPWHFIIYSDDLSFDEGEKGYKALKSILDGSVAAATPNVLIYATSNRRHLLPEYMSENLTYKHTPDGEVHPGEVVEEKISLSERFGLWISFYPFSQEEYLAIAEQWLRTLGCPAKHLAEARKEALVWALERGSRSGRVAHQFARDYVGKLGATKLAKAKPTPAAAAPLQLQPVQPQAKAKARVAAQAASGTPAAVKRGAKTAAAAKPVATRTAATTAAKTVAKAAAKSVATTASKTPAPKAAPAAVKAAAKPAVKTSPRKTKKPV